MIRLAVLGGTGDAYLMSALYRAFCLHHRRNDVELIVKTQHAAVCDMFHGVRYTVDEPLILNAERNHAMHPVYDNRLLADDQPFYAHPCFQLSRINVDKLTTKPDVSQVSMYKMILRIPHDAPLALPIIPAPIGETGTVVVLTHMTSWPNTQPGFWRTLCEHLQASGKKVALNDPMTPLSELLARCSGAAWVIGPQNGLMSLLVAGQFPCRKTVICPDIDNNRSPEYLADETYPYGYVTKFANTDHEIEEFKVTDDNHDYVANAIAYGVNATAMDSGWWHNPAPVIAVPMTITPGDFLDRLAVLTVKNRRFSPSRRIAIERELLRHRESWRLLQKQIPDAALPEVRSLLDELTILHDATFTLLENLVPEALLADEQIVFSQEFVNAHIEAVRKNKRRIELKSRIDELCHAPYREVKSYYGEE